MLLEAKLRGEEITVPEPVAEPAPMVDLLDALKASVAAAKTKGGKAGAKGERRGRRPPGEAGKPATSRSAAPARARRRT